MEQLAVVPAGRVANRQLRTNWRGVRRHELASGAGEARARSGDDVKDEEGSSRAKANWYNEIKPNQTKANRFYSIQINQNETKQASVKRS
ncbi:unnamed protein product [Plasmodium vivax]|uniref:(malaria parasite P. vivax) hypothetical protein n=1 Tax=Plasmodium vivax TaxID=5855 RepID=A0A8S4HIK3_PLAVI|nr:unnamed protein product [Plasmodium vivax]